MYNEELDFEHHRREVEVSKELFQKLGIKLDMNSTVLDLGAGQGMHIGFLSNDFRTVIGADIIEYSSLYQGEFLKLLKEKHERNSFPLDLSKVSFIQTDGMNLLFKDNFFDICYSFNVFEHIPDPEIGLKELIRVTKPGGYIYITFDPIWTADTGSHFFHRVSEPWAHLVYNENEFISRMLTAGAEQWEVEEFKLAMNKVRKEQFKEIFKRVSDMLQVNILFSDSWSGMLMPEHETHDNISILEKKGYTKEELVTRGLRYLLKKC